MSNEAIQAWLDAHNPTLHNAIHTPAAMDALTMLAAGSSSLAPSQAALTGPGAQEAASNKNWETNPVLGAVNLAQMARNAAGYNPTSLDNAGATTTQYEDFLKRLVTCPLYNIKMSDRLSVTREASNWDSVINSIADTFEGIAAKDKSTIVNGLKTLAQAASSKMETTQKEATFVQNAMNVDGVITLYLYNAETSFYEKKGKGYDTKQNTFDVVRLHLEFQKDLWPDWWQKVKNAFDGTVDDWLNDNKTSTEGTKPIPALNG